MYEIKILILSTFPFGMSLKQTYSMQCYKFDNLRFFMIYLTLDIHLKLNRPIVRVQEDLRF